ncbi:MAG: Metalloprotease MmpA [Elusimicrobia bacterium]|nr:Metalloprotease MmpA [Elusimicrobiota bacterium]
MGSIASILMTTAGILFAFALVILLHEFGHFIVAKKSGVKVERFSFGLGPEMFGIKIGETRYCVAWIPLGGEVRMAGEMIDTEGEVKIESDSGSSVDTTRHFFSQPWYKRVLIALAGPFMNYVLASVIFFGMLMVWGQSVQTNSTQVGELMAGMPAEKAGLLKGDTILRVQGESVQDFMALREKIQKRPGLETEIVLSREGKEMTLMLTPQQAEGNGPGLIGITPAEAIVERKKVGVWGAAKKSVWQCWNISAFTLYYLGQKIVKREKPDMAGPIGIGQVISKAVKSGWEDYFYLIAMISVAIGLFNLFPIPMLDGGHIFYYLIEGIRGKPLSPKIMGKANVVGLVLLLGLLVFSTMNDLQRFRQTKDKSTEAQPESSPSK